LKARPQRVSHDGVLKTMQDFESDIQSRRNDGMASGSIPEHAASKAWLLTFTDLVSLMLTFFVLLFSMSNVKPDKWDKVVVALSKTLAPSLQENSVLVTSPFNIATVYRLRSVNLDYLASILKKTMNDSQKSGAITIQRLDDRLLIALGEDQLFARGSDTLTPSGKQTLFVMGGVFSNIGNKISVNGYFDPAFNGNEKFKSGWDLSLTRSLAVAATLRDAGYPNRILSLGYRAQDQNQPGRGPVFEIVIDQSAGLLKQ